MKSEKLISKYKGVSYHYYSRYSKEVWRLSFHIFGRKAAKDFPYTKKGERDAALAYDMKRIEHGKDPVNILKKKI